MARQESPRAAELQKLRGELVNQLEQLDVRTESLDRAFAEMARQVERTIRRLTT